MEKQITSLISNIVSNIKVSELDHQTGKQPPIASPGEIICYLMTSPVMPGEIIITYNSAGLLETLHISDTLSEKQYKWLLAECPWHVHMLESFKQKTKNATFVRKRLEVTFQMFWDRYNDKDRSSKKKTEAAWNKLTEANQIKAYLYIPTYNRRRGAADKKYATTYLSDELWNN